MSDTSHHSTPDDTDVHYCRGRDCTDTEWHKAHPISVPGDIDRSDPNAPVHLTLTCRAGHRGTIPFQDAAVIEDLKRYSLDWWASLHYSCLPDQPETWPLYARHIQP